jgi:transcriptional regulator with XRE-family HTH domain
MAQRFNDLKAAVGLGARLRDARRKAGLSSLDVARRAGVHHSSVIRAEHGRYATLSPTVRKVCTVLNVDPTDGATPSAQELLLRIETLLHRKPHTGRLIAAVVEMLERELADQQNH